MIKVHPSLIHDALSHQPHTRPFRPRNDPRLHLTIPPPTARTPQRRRRGVRRGQHQSTRPKHDDDTHTHLRRGRCATPHRPQRPKRRYILYISLSHSETSPPGELAVPRSRPWLCIQSAGKRCERTNVLPQAFRSLWQHPPPFDECSRCEEATHLGPPYGGGIPCGGPPGYGPGGGPPKPIGGRCGIGGIPMGGPPP